MKLYTIISEFRSGGYTLGEWISKNESESVFAHEPWSDSNDFFTKSTDPKETSWIDKIQNNVVLKDLWEEWKDYSNLIKRSDKIICLYRDNHYDQVRSLLYAKKTKKWHGERYDREDVKIITGEEIDEYINNSGFIVSKEKFKKWREENNFFSVSYESLYNLDGIKLVVDYLDIDKKLPFPHKKRYFTDYKNLI
jgi:hypothetical protein